MSISALSLTINGAAAVLDSSGLDLTDKIATRSLLNFRVLDYAGALHFAQGMPVVLTDLSDGSVIYSGYVLSSKEKRMSAALGGLTHDIQATDSIYLADKRRAVKTYAGALAGDMVSDLVASYLAAEGVIGQHLSRIETTQADWNIVDATVGGGTLDPHLDTATSPGNLQIHRQGTTASKVWTTQADFNTGTFSGTSSTATGGGDVELSLGANYSNTLTTQADWNTGAFSATASTFSSGDVSLNGFWRNWDDNTTTGQTLVGTSATMSASGGKFTQTAAASNTSYSTFNSAPSQSNAAGGFTAEIDFVCPSGGEGGFAYYVSGGTVGYHAVYNKGSNATKIVRADGTTLASVSVTLTAGTTYRLKLVVSSSGVHTFTVNGGSTTTCTDTTATSGQVGIWVYNNAGGVVFDNFGCVQAQTGTWTSPAFSLASAKSATASAISWTATTPASTTVTLQARVSTNGGTTWTSYASCTSGSAIPNISTATDLSNAQVQFLATLSTTDTTACPLLDDMTISVTAGYPLSGTQTWTSAAYDISAAVANGGATISWTQSTPASTALSVSTSVDGGSTYQTASNGGAIANLAGGAALAGKTVIVRATLSSTVAGSTPALQDVTVTVLSGYYSSGQRVSPGYALAPLGAARSASISWTSTLNGGTLTVETSLDGVTWTAVTSGASIPGINYQGSDYIDGFDTNTSAAYAVTGSATWDTANSRLALGATNTTVVYSGASYADVDVTAETDYADAGGLQVRRDGTGANLYRLRFRDDSGDATWTATSLTLAKVVGGVATSLGTATISFPRGTLHRVKLSAHGSTISASFDDVAVISVTDSAVTAAGSVAIAGGNGIAGQVEHVQSLIVQSGGTALSAVTLYVRETLGAKSDLSATPSLADLTVALRSSQIEDGATVTNATFGYAKCSDCIDKCAEISDFWWNIDHAKRLWFRKRTALVAPRVIDGTVSTGSVLQDEDAVEYETANQAYRNREYLTGGTDITVLQTESQKGDGTSRSFTFSYKMARAPSSVTVNGTAKTVGVKGVDSGLDWYWQKGDATLAQDSAGTILTSSDTLQVQYYGLFDTVYVAQDYGAITTMQTNEGGGTTGYVEEVDQVAGLDNSTALAQFASAKLTRYALAGGKLTFATMVKGWKAGQLALVYVPWHNLNGVQMLVSQVKVRDPDGLHLWYDVECLVGPYDQTWEAFWVALADKGVDGIDTLSVGQSGTLLVPVLTSESHAHAESVTVTSYPASYPSPTLYPSASIYP